MKIKDLQEHKNLQDVLVQLPEDIYQKSSLPFYRIKNNGVYLQGWTMGDFFVKIDLKSSKIYPMFWNKVPESIKEWEVIEK